MIGQLDAGYSGANCIGPATAIATFAPGRRSSWLGQYLPSSDSLMPLVENKADLFFFLYKPFHSHVGLNASGHNSMRC